MNFVFGNRDEARIGTWLRAQEHRCGNQTGRSGMGVSSKIPSHNGLRFHPSFSSSSSSSSSSSLKAGSSVSRNMMGSGDESWPTS